jgi:protein-tyrosine-phosphatase
VYGQFLPQSDGRGLARHYRGDVLEVWSAGTAPKGVDPRAVRAMAELGIDISTHTSKHVNDLRDTVLTMWSLSAVMPMKTVLSFRVKQQCPCGL